jgi:hypothetical protein
MSALVFGQRFAAADADAGFHRRQDDAWGGGIAAPCAPVELADPTGALVPSAVVSQVSGDIDMRKLFCISIL